MVRRALSSCAPNSIYRVADLESGAFLTPGFWMEKNQPI